VYTLCAAPGHAQAQHPECPQRVTAIAEALQRHALHAHPRVSQLRPRLTADSAHQDSRLQEALQLVHPPGCLSRLAAICASLDAPSMVDDSTYISPGSYAACCEVRLGARVCGAAAARCAHAAGDAPRCVRAPQAAGAVLDVLDVVLGQHAATPHQGFCVVRPPGHHVKASRPMGFGLLNFIAVAAAHARRCPGINKVGARGVECVCSGLTQQSHASTAPSRPPRCHARCWSWIGTSTMETARRMPSLTRRQCCTSARTSRASGPTQVRVFVCVSACMRLSAHPTHTHTHTHTHRHTHTHTQSRSHASPALSCLCNAAMYTHRQAQRHRRWPGQGRHHQRAPAG
jgi:hypothetical protein